MEFNRKYITEPGCYPLQIYFVEKMNAKLLKAAKEFHIPIIEPEPNNNSVMTTPLTRTIYVFSEFEDHEMFPIVEKTPKTWILGPTALEEMSQYPYLELRSKPIYCTCMYHMVFYISRLENNDLMKRLVKLIKWMGGRFVTRPNKQTTHMIATDTLAKGYLYCITSGVPVVCPTWVEHCWHHRDLANFDATCIMEKFRLKAFSGLYIAFKGHCLEELMNFEDKALRNGANVVQSDDTRCTHLVICATAEERRLNITDIPIHISYVIKKEWFWSSITLDHRVAEDRYLCFPEIKESLWAIVDANEQRRNEKTRISTSRKSHIDAENAKIETQNKKRKYAFEDLYLKEKNFLCCLKQLCKIQDLATNLLHPEGVILSEAEAKTIFGNVARLVDIHQDFFNDLKKTMKNWENNAISVKLLIMSKDELLKQYVIYTSNYKESKQLLEELERKNKRFRKLLENFKNANKEHPKDIFIRPIQRLCSLVLQIQEISRYTREDNPDKEVLNVAIETVKDILLQMNNSQELTEQIHDTGDVQINVQDYLDYLPESRNQGELIQFVAQEVVSEGITGAQVMFVLFRNILEITKVKTKYFQLQKRQVHIATLPLSMIESVIEFQGKENDGQKVFGLNVKNTKNVGINCIYCFQYSNKDGLQLKDILILIAKQLVPQDSSKSPNNFIESSVSITGINICQITKCKEIGFRRMSNLLQVLSEKQPETNSKCNLRRSRSCGDMIDLSSVF